jgi:hypothetical protein
MIQRSSWTLPVVAAILLAAYAHLSSPDRVVVKTSGRVDGYLNVLRETLQGRHFWVEQRMLAMKELERLRAEPGASRDKRAVLDKFELELKIAQEKRYQDNPSSRPSPAAMQARDLRDLADKIELAELDRLIEASRLQNIQHLEAIVLFLDWKVSSSN